jgi:RNA 3'-terminal phosphate cyclase
MNMNMNVNMKRSKEMNSGLQLVERNFCVSAKRLSTASVEVLAEPSPAAAFPPQRMQVDAISVDTTGREVSGQKGICVQWR